MFLTIAGIVGGLAAATSIGAGIANRKVQSEEQKLQLERKQKEINDARNNLTASYDLNVHQAQEQTAQANAMIQLQAGQTEAARDQSLKTAGQSAELNDRLAASQIAALQVQTSQQEGQAVQTAAQSGFRNTGSALNVLRDVNSKAQRALNQAFLQRSISRFSDYASARDNYINANNQLEIYRRQAENNEADLARYKESAELTYRQNLAEIEKEQKYLNEDKDFMNSSAYKWAQGLGYASDIFGGLNTGMNTYNNAYRLGQSFGLI